MSTLTIRLPDDKQSRLKALADSRKISMNRLVDELATLPALGLTTTGCCAACNSGRSALLSLYAAATCCV